MSKSKKINYVPDYILQIEKYADELQRMFDSYQQRLRRKQNEILLIKQKLVANVVSQMQDWLNITLEVIENQYTYIRNELGYSKDDEVVHSYVDAIKTQFNEFNSFLKRLDLNERIALDLSQDTERLYKKYHKTVIHPTYGNILKIIVSIDAMNLGAQPTPCTDKGWEELVDNHLKTGEFLVVRPHSQDNIF
jgi:hypothetical protein